MLRLFQGLKSYMKKEELVPDNVVFRLHYSFTTILLLVCSLIITGTTYVGSPIECIVNNEKLVKFVNTFCWITSTFTMPDAFNRKVGEEVPHPGVSNDYGMEDDKKYYTYYQWVCFALFFQAISCYAPKFIWDLWEGGLLRTIAMGLNTAILNEEEKALRKKALLGYLLAHENLHYWYVMRYWFCESLCLINILAQLYFMNWFFDGEFMDYGWRSLTFSETPQEERVDPMVYIFPRVTKCIFHKYGPSGSIERIDVLCILPLNVVNEKTYIFIWFWFLGLLFLLTFLVLFRVVIVLVPLVRPILLRASNKIISKAVSETISRKTSIQDWWIIYMLSRSINPVIYRDIVTEMAHKIDV